MDVFWDVWFQTTAIYILIVVRTSHLIKFNLDWALLTATLHYFLDVTLYLNRINQSTLLMMMSCIFSEAEPNLHLRILVAITTPNVVVEWVTLHLHSGGPRFKSRRGDRTSCLRVLWFSQPFQANARRVCLP
jgi:hypothetical protein